MSYACAEKFSSEVRDRFEVNNRSKYREQIVSALQLIDPQKLKAIMKERSAEEKAKKQAKKEAKEKEMEDRRREKEHIREMKMLEMQALKAAKKQQKGLKQRKPKYDFNLDNEDDTPVITEIVCVKRINAKGEHVSKGTPGGDYLLDADNTVYCANKREIIGKWCQTEERIVFKR